ncbi:protein MpABC24 [Marchantia polymorpha subsp. ruderalis]|uniref:ABC transporter domain-containing protein n=2 Tax=Marchantia polymorpha TaxID=3197 RepID=A0A176VZ92_MARPO|nr:hypothetical protein AXG93_4022s1230 [Marchantia polymorpha subsp. ruderalis]PTQ31577.1 hypothetical protein MARPO_0109s0010 [Marchantia polymorpha]BBN02619.1 hypothetical protein Mp_2g16690 [Marchantia polymorpha subsp. ruderalis]|eukprot:PTQ31577.1 hypothetical protein MARPO_0109s0010 [Marchantia polymorpha]
MTSVSVFSDSPGSESTVSEAPPNSEHTTHFSFPFSMIRNQRAATVTSVQSVPVKQKSLTERIPTFKSLMGQVREETKSSRASLSASQSSDASQPNGVLKSHLSRKVSKTFEKGATIVWKDLTITVSERKGAASKAVQGVTGYARPGSMLALMGSPESGVSTLLQALAGKLPTTAKVYGEILLNGHPRKFRNRTYAYVKKQDELIETLTIRETLFYAALLQLPDRLPCSEKLARVDYLISEMDLEDLSGARIGKCGEIGALTRGKRRRVSIALQLLTKPWLVFVDHPVDYLDSVSAFVVMGVLKKLTNEGCTVITSIEQMNSEVFNLLDKVCLLSSGKTIFFGRATAALEHYASAGMPCPAMYNPADHLLRAINTEYDRVNAPFRFAQDSEHGEMWGQMDTAVIIRTLETMYQASGDAALVQSMVSHLSEKEKTILDRGGCASPFMRLGIVTWRSFLNMWRDFNYIWLRLIVSMLLTICIGSLASKIGHSYNSVSARIAAIFSVVSSLSLVAISGFPSILKDIKVHMHEREIGYTGVLMYTIGNLLSSALYLFLIAVTSTSVGYFLMGLQTAFSPFVYFVVNIFLCLLAIEGLMLFVASILPRALEGILTIVVIQVLMIVLAGYYQVSGDMPNPVWKYPASYLPVHAYAIEGLLQNEYETTTFDAVSRRSPPISGIDAIKRDYPFAVTDIGKWNILLVLAGMAIAYRIFFCICLIISQKLGSRRTVHKSST